MFTFVGLRKVIQSDLGSNFMSNIFKQVVTELGLNIILQVHITQNPKAHWSVFTLKNTIRTYCTENKKEWDEGIQLFFFASKESVQDLMGYSLFELILGHTKKHKCCANFDFRMDD